MSRSVASRVRGWSHNLAIPKIVMFRIRGVELNNHYDVTIRVLRSSILCDYPYRLGVVSQRNDNPFGWRSLQSRPVHG